MLRFAVSFPMSVSNHRWSGDLLRELYGYCWGLTVMSFSMLLVTGFDLVLVGHFEFAVVAPYSVAAAMITFISGLLSAIINVVLPHAATLHAREKAEDMGNWSSRRRALARFCSF